MTATPAHLFELGASMAGAGESLHAILRVLLDEGATDLDLVRVTKKIERVSFKRARELIEESGLIMVGPKQVTMIVPEDDPWYGELCSMNSPDEDGTP
jgi:hypothetical protein